MKNKKNNYLGLFSILMLSILGIIISCSTKDKNPLGLDEILEDEIAIIEEEILEQFKQNYSGTYTPEDSATINMDGFTMPFAGLTMNLSTSILENNKLYFNIMYNGDQGTSTLKRIMFTEGKETYSPNKQEVIPETSTNAYLKNVYAFTSGDTIEGNNTIAIIVNPDNGDLIFDGVKIGTKQ